jgi:uncharacterized MAPEG superfamily protein
MTFELTILTLAALLQCAQFVLMAVPINLQVGTEITAGPRDAPIEAYGIPARLKRAMDNHFEALVLFTIAVLVVTLADQSSAITRIAAANYLIARIFYIPAYAYGWTPWRSAIWCWGWLSTITMLIAALI